MIWDFSSTGALDGVKEFFWSLLKTVIIAALSYLALRLGNLHLSGNVKNLEIYTTLIVLGRAFISGFMQWVTTLPGTVQSAG